MAFSNDDPGLILTIFMTGSNLFPYASVWMTAYTALSARVFQVCSNSAYPQLSGGFIILVNIICVFSLGL